MSLLRLPWGNPVIARLTATVAATAAVSLALVTPAQANPVDVNGCGATATSNGTATCVFVAQPGYYALDLWTTARYAWAQVSCPLGGSLYVNAWDYEGWKWVDGNLSGGVCTLSVSAGTGGSARALTQLH